MSSQPVPYSGGFIENAPVVTSFISADETDPEITTLIQLFKASFAHREVDGHNSLSFFCTCTIPTELLTVKGTQSASGKMGIKIGLVCNDAERLWCAESAGLKAQHAVDETICYAFPSLGWMGPVSSEKREPTESKSDSLQRLAKACREAAAIEGDTPEATRDRRLIYARYGVPTRLNFTMMQGDELKTFPANGPNHENGRLLATCSEARILADYEGIEHPAFKFLTAFSTPRGGEPLASGEAGVAFDVIDLDRHGEVDGVAAFDGYLKSKELSLEELLSTCLWSQTKSQGIHIFIKHLGALSRSVAFEGDLKGVEIKSLRSFETLPNSFCRAWSPAEKRTVAGASYILKGAGDVVEGGPYYDAFRNLLQRPELHRDKPKNALPPSSASTTGSEWERNTLRNCLVAIVDKQTDNVANAGEGGRNIALFSAVKTVAGHAANYERDFSDVIGYDIAFDRFLSAAEQCGLKHDEAEATIKSGWKAGYNAPLDPIPIIKRSPLTKSDSLPSEQKPCAYLPISKIIERAQSFKSGAQFQALFNGEDENGESIPPSEQGLYTLLNLVTFAAGPDIGRIDAIMRQSAMLSTSEMKAMWADSGQARIEDAVAKQKSFYLELLAKKKKAHSKREEKKAESQAKVEAATACFEGEPEIPIIPGILSEIAQQTMARLALKELSKSDPAYIQGGLNPIIYETHGRKLARLCSTKNESGELSKVLAIELLDKTRLQSELDDAKLHFTKLNGRTQEFVPCDAPIRLAEKIIASRSWPGIPFLRGVLTTPFLRLNGDVHVAPGYDIETKFFSSWVAGFTSTSLTEAKNLLLSSIEEFPFVDDVDRSVAFASLLTAAIRPQISNAPALAVTASTPGTGKSALCSLMSIMCVGERMPTVDFTEDEESFKKALTAILRERSPVVVVDNVKPFASVNNSFLCSILTEQQVTSRTLGVSEMGTYSTQALWCINGNKLNAPADMIRRLLYCRLQRDEENPHEHKFSRPDLMQWAITYRKELVQSAFSILSAYIKEGMPKPKGWSPRVGYKDWSNLIAGACVWCGLSNPLESQENLKDSDPQRAELYRLLCLWERAFGYDWIPARKLVECASSAQPSLDSSFEENQDFRLIGELIADHFSGKVHAKGVSRFLNEISGKVVHSKKLAQKVLHGTTFFALVFVTKA